MSSVPPSSTKSLFGLPVSMVSVIHSDKSSLGCVSRCHSFLVTSAHICNDLPVYVTSAPSLLTFRKWL